MDLDNSQPKLNYPQKSRSNLFLIGGVSLLSVLLVVTFVQWWPEIMSEINKPSLEERIPNFSGAVAGLLVDGVSSGSIAERVGLKKGDVIIGYGNKAAIDTANYEEARIYYDSLSHIKEVTLTVYQNNSMKPVLIKVPKGKLGMFTTEWTLLKAFVYDAVVNREDYKQAEELINKAETDKRYSANQILRAKLFTISNGNSQEQVKQRKDLVEQFYSKYPPKELTYWTGNELLPAGRNIAAAAMFEKYLEYDPEDVDTRFNLAASYSRTFFWDKAEKELDYVLNQPNPSVSDYGYSVVEDIRGVIALGRKEYKKAAEYFKRKMLEDDTNSYYPLVYIYSIAKLGDVEKFNEAVEHTKTVVPQFQNYQHRIDMLGSYFLTIKGNKDEARELVQKWKASPYVKEDLKSFWPTIPDSQEITDNWTKLMEE